MASPKKIDGRKTDRKVMEEHRFQALKLRKKGMMVKDIANLFGIGPNSVSRWFVKKRKFGKGVLERRKAPGAKRKLSNADFKKIEQWISKPASKFGFENDLWTSVRFKRLIKDKIGITLDESNIWRLLRVEKISYQKPEKRAIQQNKEVVEKWLNEEWPKIKELQRKWNAILYFLDEAGISLIPPVGRTWAPEGKTPTIRVTGKKGGLCVTSAISKEGRMVFRIENEKINAERHIEFLEQIRKHHKRRKIIVVEDNARPHTAKATREFAEKNKTRFALYYIPPYSPELNPDENTWAHLKGHELVDHQAKTTDSLRSVVLFKLRSMQMRPQLIQSLFHADDLS